MITTAEFEAQVEMFRNASEETKKRIERLAHAAILTDCLPVWVIRCGVGANDRGYGAGSIASL